MHYDPQHNPNKDDAEMPMHTTKKKGRKKFVIIPVVVVLLIIATFMLLPSNVSRQEAMNIAITHVGGGTANQPDRDFERFQRAWSVEVFYSGLVHEVYVSMRTGKVIGMEIDRWD